MLLDTYLPFYPPRERFFHSDPNKNPTFTVHGTHHVGMSLNEAMTGAELLRLAGGPARGWYPRHRQARPASVEHLDRLHQGLSPGSHQAPPGPWDPSRKPQTLPPNLTPKFFHRSPREALRRVTSLLIRRGTVPSYLPVREKS